jgi:hypothetical protein
VLVSALVLAAASHAAPVEPASRIRLYTYSRDSAFGFKDELLDAFRRELAKHVETLAEVAYSSEEAQVSVQLLGRGELTAELGLEKEPTRYLFRADDRAPRMWALVRVGSFSKEFSIEGSGTRDLSRLAKALADWLQENSGTIRDRPPR